MSEDCWLPYKEYKGVICSEFHLHGCAFHAYDNSGGRCSFGSLFVHLDGGMQDGSQNEGLNKNAVENLFSYSENYDIGNLTIILFTESYICWLFTFTILAEHITPKLHHCGTKPWAVDQIGTNEEYFTTEIYSNSIA